VGVLLLLLPLLVLLLSIPNAGCELHQPHAHHLLMPPLPQQQHEHLHT
jgi:hypothetical protein